MTDWLTKAGQLRWPTRHFVDGAFIDAYSEVELPVVSPRDGSRLPRVAAGNDKDIDRAVHVARAAFSDGRWADLSPATRGATMVAFSELVAANSEELALMIALEMGKPVREALAVELRATARCLRWYGEAADKVYDEKPVTGPNSFAYVSREPAGVVAAVVPWNFPLTMAAWKLGPALVTGNSVVLKPAEQTPFSALRLAELGAEAGIPPGVLNVVPGRGDIAGRALGVHPDVDVVTFTGSPRVGRAFLSYSAESNGKRVWPELGGKSASIVLPDADLERAARTSAWGAFYNQGEMCSASSRLVVHRDVADEVIAYAIDEASRMRPADPLEETAPLGAMASAAHLSRVAGYVDMARREGATVATSDADIPAGTYFAPTVLTEVTPDMRVAQEEIFGPVLSVLVVDTVDEAIEVANGTPYGLAAALWSNDLSTVHRVSRRLRAGIVWVNCFEEGDMTVPFGGVKQSGFGRDKSLHALDKFTDLKTTWIELGS